MHIIKKDIFDSLDDTALIWACIEPAINPIRGKDLKIKVESYVQLNPGQQALLMFQVFSGHTIHGAMEFYDHLSYLLSESGVWSELKKGMQYFHGLEIYDILVEMEDLYSSIVRTDHPDLYDIQLTLSRLDMILYERMPEMTKLVGAYIRNHPDEFVLVAD